MKNYFLIALLSVGLFTTVSAQDKATKKEVKTEKKESKGKAKKEMKKERAKIKKEEKSK